MRKSVSFSNPAPSTRRRVVGMVVGDAQGGAVLEALDQQADAVAEQRPLGPDEQVEAAPGGPLGGAVEEEAGHGGVVHGLEAPEEGRPGAVVARCSCDGRRRRCGPGSPCPPRPGRRRPRSGGRRGGGGGRGRRRASARTGGTHWALSRYRAKGSADEAADVGAAVGVDGVEAQGGGHPTVAARACRPGRRPRHARRVACRGGRTPGMVEEAPASPCWPGCTPPRSAPGSWWPRPRPAAGASGGGPPRRPGGHRRGLPGVGGLRQHQRLRPLLVGAAAAAGAVVVLPPGRRGPGRRGALRPGGRPCSGCGGCG